MNKSIKLNIKKLRLLLKKNNLDGFIIPHEDEFLTEYTPPSSDRLHWITGFSGSAGMSIINERNAVIFVDGRYTTQVKMESPSEFFDFEDLNIEKQKKWIRENCKSGYKLGFSPKIISSTKFKFLEKIANEESIELVECKNFVDQIWLDRPNEPNGEIIYHEEKFSGKNFKDKKTNLLKVLNKEKVDSLFISESDNTCWLLNIRGHDLDYTPLARCFSILEKTGEIFIFSNHKISKEIKEYFNKNKITILDIESIKNFIEKAKYKRTLFDPNTTPLEIAKIIQENSSAILKSNPCNLMKACKNSTEISGSKNAHIRDGVALTKFLFWLENKAEENKVDEIIVEKKLLEYRKKNKELKSLSFSTIAGTGGNGAIVHYKANKETNKMLKSGDLLLLDSGGQYFDGTTDVTRTVPVFSNNNISEEIKDRYTRVLKGHIAIANSIFPKGTKGMDLDPLARKYLLEIGLNYSHGTGHGVGSFLGVHEGPQNISPLGSEEIRKGMIISNEPGYYKENEYAIRIENLIYVKEDKKNNNLLYFETLTMSPIDKSLIDKNLLNIEEKNWLNNYHSKVLKKISPFLDINEKIWLKKSCEAIH